MRMPDIDPAEYDLARYTDKDLCNELRRRKSKKDRTVDDDVDLGPMGAWRSFYGQLAFDENMHYQGLRLPCWSCPGAMEFKSLHQAKLAVRAAGVRHDDYGFF